MMAGFIYPQKARSNICRTNKGLCHCSMKSSTSNLGNSHWETLRLEHLRKHPCFLWDCMSSPSMLKWELPLLWFPLFLHPLHLWTCLCISHCVTDFPHPTFLATSLQFIFVGGYLSPKLTWWLAFLKCYPLGPGSLPLWSLPLHVLAGSSSPT